MGWRRRLIATVAVGASLGLVLGLLGQLEILPIRSWNLEARIGDVLFGVSGIALVAVCVRTFGERAGRYWLVLTSLFVVAFVAKVTGGVSKLEDRLRSIDSNPAWNGWQTSSLVIVALQAILAVGLGLFFIKWVLSLEPPVRRRILAGGAVFLTGAVGMEAVTEWVWSAVGSTSVFYVVADWIENGAEAAGLIVFLDGLLTQLATGTTRHWQRI
jgi:hypothetical protein